MTELYMHDIPSDNQREESIDGQIRECKEFAGRRMIFV